MRLVEKWLDSFCIGDNKLRLYFDRDLFSIIFLLF